MSLFACLLICSFAHSLTHLCTHSTTHSLTLLLIPHSLLPCITHSLIHPPSPSLHPPFPHRYSPLSHLSHPLFSHVLAGNIALSLTLALVIPMTIWAFTFPLPYLTPAPPLGSNFILGVVILLAGLITYNAPSWLPALRKRGSPMLSAPE